MNSSLPHSPLPPSAQLFPVTVDIILLTIRHETLCALLIERALPPFEGMLALPGGFVLPDESLSEAARRELAEETDLTPIGHLEQLRTYGPLNRDPRGPVFSVAYLLLAPTFDLPSAGGDARTTQWVPIDTILHEEIPLAFDHAQIVRDGVERARAKLEYSDLATAFCPEEFTIEQLRKVYEAVWGTTLDPRNFHRKATGTKGFIQPTGHTSGGMGRPAALYRATRGANPHGVVLYPPLLRPLHTPLQGKTNSPSENTHRGSTHPKIRP